ncbi:Putative serine protease HtrA [Gemmata obscuriglobus]|uniref:PDZ domain-containing protein n=1 Tax=Gemmata obscuriglobus TaxID=114 RepID=A0A2Z3H606_9BACT|nr:PDZ domain-containing protein [Gemmata obscuriglobus]AWM38555.1 hypothetical protein C1280_17255 [Gemmata obscuriglobus]QEG28490.1 Putative serine protease HtrA [Gemmata obscuriglobus]VTS06520.1 protease do : Serine protease, trypsin family OS=uncultured planctomycete GN=HGMM_F01A04C13 PE=4 SV=1: PDZ_2: PDZ_2 [Gemmata obscuriglobus UQM 2246]
MTHLALDRARLWVALAVLAVAATAAVAQPAADVNEATEKAMKAAVAKVAPAVVQVTMSGGTDFFKEQPKNGPPGARPAPGMRKGTGPTTGLIVSPQGHVITSSFNFVGNNLADAKQITACEVAIPGKDRRFVYHVIGRDETRMLTLLAPADKTKAPTGLTPAQPLPKADVEIGQWALALGRALDTNVESLPAMSVGIVSATNRIWGKAIQTDAKASPVNYGGPLVSVDGRVYGVVVPASSRAEGETAGVDVYDGGIGFAVPLEDVLKVLPKLQQGTGEKPVVLRRGLLGITQQGTGMYIPPVVGSVQPDSAAARAGIKVGDTITEINGTKVPTYSTLQHVMGPLYEDDVISLKVSRGGKDVEFKGVKLLGTSAAFVSAYFGVLPMRDDPGPGVEVRFVYPKSPADTAGIKAGDRIMKFGPGTPVPVQNRQALMQVAQRLTPGTEVKVEVKRKEGGKVETLTTTLTPAPNEVPEKLPLPSSAGKALEGQPKPKENPKDPFPKKDPFGKAPFSDVRAETQDEKKDDPKKDKPKVETGFLTRNDQALGREYWLYVPDNYDANVSHGLVVWFHPAGQGGKDGEKMSTTFRNFAEDNHFIVMGPKAGAEAGWRPGETELVVNDVKAVMGEYTIDKTRVVAHGLGNGGEMAFYVGFNARDLFRGVAPVGAALGNPPKDNIPNQPLSFFITAGDKDPLLKDIQASQKLLAEQKRFPVIFREMKESGKEYYDQRTFTDFLNWLDSLDRI